MPKIEQEEKSENEATEAELQKYLNGVTLNIPKDRRDLTVPGNLGWLNRNIYIKNHVPEKYMKALSRLFKEKSRQK